MRKFEPLPPAPRDTQPAPRHLGNHHGHLGGPVQSFRHPNDPKSTPLPDERDAAHTQSRKPITERPQG